jgi:hypothetical protein
VQQQTTDNKCNLILLVPAFREKPQRNQSVETLVSHFAAWFGRANATSINVAGYVGKHITGGPTQTKYQFFALYWQDLATQLTNEKIYTQIVRGAVLLIARAWRALTRPKYLAWGLYLTLGLMAMAIWLYGISASGLSTLGNVQGLDKTLVDEARRLATAMLAWPVLVYVTMLLGVLSINLGTIVDITDLINRYFTETIEPNQLTLREQYGKMICQSVSSLVEQGPFDKVTIVGCSFGCAIIVDAIAGVHNEWLPTCTLVTLGGFLEFLTAQYPSIEQRIQACLKEPRISRWFDFYASDDLLTTNSPLATDSKAYCGVLTNSGAGLLDRITGRSHSYYFKNQEVLKAIA